MKNLAIAILVFCTFICAAYSSQSFKCYECGDDTADDNSDYTTEQCDKDKKIIECPAYANGSCYKLHGTTLDDKEREFRGCMTKQQCESIKTNCEEGTAKKVKECEAACCVSDGDIPCNSGFTVSTTSSFTNSGFTVSIDMIMIMFAVVCSLELF